MNPNQLIREDPQFGLYLTTVMTELTGVTAEEWIYECWKAHVHGVPPAEFVKEWLNPDEEDNNSI